MEARNDGSAARALARGFSAVVAPNGAEVAYLASARRGRLQLRVIGRRGRSRLLAPNVYDTTLPGVDTAFSWSLDSRWIVVGDRSARRAATIDVARHRTAGFIPLEMSFGGGSFSPNGAHVAVGSEGLRRATIVDVDLRGFHRKTVASGDDPVWGRPGLAFHAGAGIKLKRSPRSNARVIFTPPAGELAFPVTWAKRNRELLAAVSNSGGYRAVLIDPATGRSNTLAPVLSSVDGLSRDGALVVAEAGGNIVQVTRTGTMQVLVRGASEASWNR